MKLVPYRALAVALLAASAAACNDPTPPAAAQTAKKAAPAAAPAPQNKEASAAAAKQMFAERCAPCHGASGKGDGPGAAALTPKPRDYTDAAWQKSVTDDTLRKVIIMGGAAAGKSPIMPGSPDLEGKPEVVDGLVQIVRGFGPK